MLRTAKTTTSIVFGTTLCLGAAPIAAQATGSTLTQLANRSDAIATARVLRMQDDGLVHRATFKLTAFLQGDAKSIGLSTAHGLTSLMHLSEPASQSCGRALHGMLVGASYVLFLRSAQDGPRLTIAAAQSAVRLDPEVLSYLREYVGSSRAEDQVGVMTKALSSRSYRVRRDAAIALPLHSALDKTKPVDRARILEALAASVGTEEDVTYELLRTAVRLRLRSAARVLLPHYLKGVSPAMDRVLTSALPTLDGAFVAQQLARAMPEGTPSKHRAIRLLRNCPTGASTVCLEQLTKSRTASVANLAHAALMERSSATGAVTPFRSIDPRSRRERMQSRRDREGTER